MHSVRVINYVKAGVTSLGRDIPDFGIELFITVIGKTPRISEGEEKMQLV